MPDYLAESSTADRTLADLGIHRGDHVIVLRPNDATNL